MTVPVSTEWKPVESEEDQIEKTMCFYLGHKHQTSPPKPSDENVFIDTRPEMSVYTR